jgi:DNA topoisomerase-1
MVATRPGRGEASATAPGGLHYVDPTEPGISRRRQGRGFAYRSADGTPVTSASTLARIRSLAIPPAWRDVWICSSPHGHIQAVGRDARRRLQYRYHPLWQQLRDVSKFERTIAFARALPRLRRRVERDLRRRGLPREKVLAAVVRLLQTTLIRVGNEEYARSNGSFGVTTLRNRHARIGARTLKLSFRGKGGKQHVVGLRDQRLARVVKACQELPGQRLFQYVDGDGQVQRVNSEDVNEYLRSGMNGEDFSAKDFRTWAGTLLAVVALSNEQAEARKGAHGVHGVRAEAALKRSLARAVKDVARKLGNTPAVCRRCYIHPHVVDAFLDGTMTEELGEHAGLSLAAPRAGLSAPERRVLALLERKRVREGRQHRRAA